MIWATENLILFEKQVKTFVDILDGVAFNKNQECKDLLRNQLCLTFSFQHWCLKIGTSGVRSRYLSTQAFYRCLTFPAFPEMQKGVVDHKLIEKNYNKL